MGKCKGHSLISWKDELSFGRGSCLVGEVVEAARSQDKVATLPWRELIEGCAQEKYCMRLFVVWKYVRYTCMLQDIVHVYQILQRQQQVDMCALHVLSTRNTNRHSCHMFKNPHTDNWVLQSYIPYTSTFYLNELHHLNKQSPDAKLIWVPLNRFTRI